MSLRLVSRRALRIDRRFVAASALTTFLLAIGSSSAIAQTIAITPCATGCTTSSSSFPAGGHPSVTTTVALDSASDGAPQTATVKLLPGFLASVAAVPACVAAGASADTSACVIGGGTVQTALPGFLSLPFSAYLTPPTKPSDVAGIDIVTAVATVHGEISLAQNADGTVSVLMAVDLTSVPSLIRPLMTGMTLSLNGTAVNGKPLTRMPSRCSIPAADASSLTVVYGSGATAKTVNSTASPDATPTGCSALGYAPVLTAKATKAANGPSVDLTTVVTQAPTEAASRSVSLTVPPKTVQPYLVNALNLFGKQVGTASAISPLLPGSLTGTVTLGGSFSAPTLTIAFPPPAALSLTGTVNLTKNSVTFANVPDVPLTNLTVDLVSGSNAMFETTCVKPSGVLRGGFVGQNGTSKAANIPLSVTGCPAAGHGAGKPVASRATLSGVGTGHPKLSFTLTAGRNAPKLKSLTVTAPAGLTFSGASLAHSVSVSGAKIRSIKLSHGRLTVTLRSGTSKLRVTVSAAALKASAGLRTKVKRMQVKTLVAKLTVKDAGNRRTGLKLRVEVRS